MGQRPWTVERTWPFLRAMCISNSGDCSTASASDNISESCWLLLRGFVAMATAVLPHLNRENGNKVLVWLYR